MRYRITITRDAKSQLLGFAARERRLIGDGIAVRLHHQPTITGNTIKALRPNPFAGYELRLGDYRVLYNVDEENYEVTIVAVGQKQGEKLIIEGEEFDGHKGDPAE